MMLRVTPGDPVPEAHAVHQNGQHMPVPSVPYQDQYLHVLVARSLPHAPWVTITQPASPQTPLAHTSSATRQDGKIPATRR